MGGNGSVVGIRPTNNCGSGLSNNSIPVYVGITRPNAPVLKLNGASSVTFYCGDASAKTFTVLNPAACVTSYEWVTANKGWFDANGIAITGNIITTTPSLTIYPSCASSNPAKDIEVLMKSGTEMLSSKVTVAFSSAAPPLAISGASEFCTSSTYTVPVSTACGASISWSLQPLNNYPFPVTLSCTNCSSTTLTKLNGGTAILRATVAFANCNSTGIYEKYIGVGVPLFKGWYNSPTNSLQPLNPWTRQNLDATNEVCYGTYITTVTDITANASVIWAESGNSGGVTWTQIGNNLRFYFSDIDQWAFFSVIITNSCGTKSLRYRFNSTGATSCGGPLLKVAVSPNPSTNMVNVTLTEKEGVQNKKEIMQIKILDKLGNAKQVKNFNSLLDANVDVTDLPMDIYTIMVFDGKQWYSTKFVRN